MLLSFFMSSMHFVYIVFYQKGACETKVCNIKLVTISFAFKQSRKVFLFSSYLEQINC